jgi:hypothetical protein
MRRKPTNNKKYVKSVLEDAVRNILLDADELGATKSKRISTLMDIGTIMEKMADELKVKALTEEEGEDRITAAKKVMDETLEEVENCLYDNPGDAVEEAIEAMGEHGKLCEALTYLESVEEAEAEEE